MYLANYFNYLPSPLLLPVCKEKLLAACRACRVRHRARARCRYARAAAGSITLRTAKRTNAGPASAARRAARPARMCLRERPRAPAEAQDARAVDRGALGKTHHAPAQQHAPPVGGRGRACLAVDIRCAPSVDPYQYTINWPLSPWTHRTRSSRSSHRACSRIAMAMPQLRVRTAAVLLFDLRAPARTLPDNPRRIGCPCSVSRSSPAARRVAPARPMCSRTYAGLAPGLAPGSR
ncbi:hypothetical protein PsYK624_107690 [Phanerochaete sordida]|uniref:Uncharacterized protein n=1 Tax=Phanerochaete sordida TaxID=48140 RepID=A0A9P3LHE8_9APHY|nr:hypothetical protein PsYK624_107690 [Phanerochaete sordida]